MAEALQQLLIIDTETTGLDSRQDQLCEVGAILFSIPQRSPLLSLALLLPVASNGAEAINHIPPALTQEPLPRAEALALFLALVRQADAYVAHNAAFDRDWIEALLPFELQGSRPWLCSCEDMHWQGLRPQPSLQTLALAHGVPVWACHRALHDCQYLAQVLERDPDLEEHLQQALEPRTLVVADIPYQRREDAKEAGFRWWPQEKQWRRRCSAAEVAALPFPVTPVAEGG